MSRKRLKTGYKVCRVRVRDGQEEYYSAVMAFSAEWRPGIRYQVGVFVKPKPGFGPLGVFASLRNAKDFVVEYGEPTERYVYFQSLYTASKAKKMWSPKSKLGRRTEVWRKMFPRGTALATSVNLVKEVK